MPEETVYPRFLSVRIREALADSPVVLIHGPRQCGKTTLTKIVGDEGGFTYFTFDDDVQRAAARPTQSDSWQTFRIVLFWMRCNGFRNYLLLSRRQWMSDGDRDASS